MQVISSPPLCPCYMQGLGNRSRECIHMDTCRIEHEAEQYF